MTRLARQAPNCPTLTRFMDITLNRSIAFPRGAAYPKFFSPSTASTCVDFDQQTSLHPFRRVLQRQHSRSMASSDPLLAAHLANWSIWSSTRRIRTFCNRWIPLACGRSVAPECSPGSKQVNFNEISTILNAFSQRLKRQKEPPIGLQTIHQSEKNRLPDHPIRHVDLTKPALPYSNSP